MEVKDRIRGKAEELFKKFGLRTVTMDEIATQSGVSKKTIYQYYEDKDALVAAVIDEEVGRSETQCYTGSETAKDAIHEIFMAMDHLEHTFNDMNPSVFYDLERFHFPAFQRLKKFKETFLDSVIRNNIQRGIAEGLYRPEINVDMLSRLRVACSMGLVFDQETFPQSRFNVVALQKELLEHFVFGLATAKGHKMILKYKAERERKLMKKECGIQSLFFSSRNNDKNKTQ